MWRPPPGLTAQIERAMPAFCTFYAMTPDEYRALSVRDFAHMARFMREVTKKG